jgi:hypothetical protein
MFDSDSTRNGHAPPIDGSSVRRSVGAVDATPPTHPDIERIDHMAITVADFDATVATLTGALGLRCARIGRLGGDSARRIAMIADGTGFKLEIIDGIDARLVREHLGAVGELTPAHEARAGARGRIRR